MALIDDCILYYKLDSNSAITDATGNNNGTNEGATYTASGKLSGGYDFDGSNDYIQVLADGSSYFNASSFTISMWIKPETLTSASLWSYDKNGGHTSPYYSQHVQTTSDGYIYFAYNVGGVYDIIRANTAAVISTGTWYHVMVTWTSGAQAIYVNNVSKATGSDSGAITYYASPVRIGESENLGQNFDGIIDEVGFWDRVLTSDERAELYNSGTGLQYPFTTGLNMKINIGDSWKAVSAAKINIGDSWKTVSAIKQNIGDTWKTV